MSSVFNERLSGKLAPTPGGSVYVDPSQLEWQPSQFPKIQMMVLYRDDAVGEMTVLLKWEPGAVLPFHKHPEIEQSFVLEGSFYDHDGICRAGQFVYRVPGSMHETRSDEGCLLLAVYRKPNIFFKSARFVAS
ncbi:cupin domain-containing protein [Variovorax rhizosphaerae]|uniref:Cupin domain-containing protein n=1 Tax=Variovorax rhizosphaerae TaxID=1836200 RepID=A0ABU8WMC4_9BURK